MEINSTEWEKRADKIQQHFFRRGATISRADFDYLLSEIEKSYQEGVEAERERIDRLIRETMDGMEFQTNAEFIACDDFAIKVIKRFTPTNTV